MGMTCVLIGVCRVRRWGWYVVPPSHPDFQFEFSSASASSLVRGRGGRAGQQIRNSYSTLVATRQAWFNASSNRRVSLQPARLMM